MHPKRKNTNKENKKQPKRVPLATILPSYTEDIPLTGYQSAELKSGPKTLDLRKPSSGNPYKKTVSRKSNSKSVKQHPSYQPPKLKSLMKQFKELKLLHQNERSKSRSPASCKSRSIEKYIPKRLSFKTFSNSRHSEPNLTLKLEKTLKKLNETNFFREDDSLIPLSSSSGDLSQRKRQVLFTEHDEIVDLGQVRQFCSTVTLSFKKSEGLAFKTYDLFKETMAALKIQRAWRKYQTKRIIGQYAFLYQQDQSHHYLHRHQGPLTPKMEDNSFEPIQIPQSEVVLMSEDCYDSSVEGERRVRKVSNLQSEGSVGEEDDVVTKMKIQELQKWNKIINIISASKNQEAKSLECLLGELARQSQLNKMQLEQRVKSAVKNSPSSQFPKDKSTQIRKSQDQEKRTDNKKKAQHQRDQSSSSQGMQEYDSKKYIQYLDGDIFVEESLETKHQQSKGPFFITKSQQEILLKTLNQSHDSAHIGQYALNKSESLSALLKGSEQDCGPSSRETLKRSTSEKALKKILSQFQEDKQSDEEINLDLLTKEFLEGSDPLTDNFDMVYSQQKLRSKLAELNRFKNENQQNWDYEEQQHTNFEPQNPSPQIVQQPMLQKETLEEVSQIRPRAGRQIRIEENQSPVKVEIVEEGIASSSDEAVSEEDQQSETVAAILMNSLVVEVLKEIASNNKLSAAFKSYSLSLKPKVRKSEGKKKKGFPTTKAEIQHFIEGLLAYLEREEPNVYQNLDVPTGPSALEMLRYMHQSGEDSWDSGSDQEDSNVMVIPNRVFDAFWGIKQRSIIIEVPEGYDQGNSLLFKHQFELLKSFNKIFYRSLFDTFNQCLDLERNYGQYGKPFPWKKTPVFEHQKSKIELYKSVKKAKSRMLELSTTYCGLIVEKEEMASLSEDYLQQVHEDRLSRMLAGDLLQAEERWVFYDDQQTEILVEVANAVYTELLIELIENLYGLA